MPADASGAGSERTASSSARSSPFSNVSTGGTVGTVEEQTQGNNSKEVGVSSEVPTKPVATKTALNYGGLPSYFGASDHDAFAAIPATPIASTNNGTAAVEQKVEEPTTFAQYFAQQEQLAALANASKAVEDIKADETEERPKSAAKTLSEQISGVLSSSHYFEESVDGQGDGDTANADEDDVVLLKTQLAQLRREREELQSQLNVQNSAVKQYETYSQSLVRETSTTFCAETFVRRLL